MLSILILTKNEEVDLPDCLASVQWCDDVVIFDSFSTDQTGAIARSKGARLFQRQFDNYAAQRNAALTEVVYKYPWILMLDADERATEELAREIREVISNGNAEVTLFRMRRKDMLFGRWLKRSSGYPTWFGRLLRKGRVWVEREINEEYHTDGIVGHLKNHLVHYPFNKGLAHWFDRHNKYSTMEAAKLLAAARESLEPAGLLSKDPVMRRKRAKQLAYRIPGRPLWAFIYLYFFRLGFLDGAAGLAFSILRGIYEYMIDLKVKESLHAIAVKKEIGPVGGSPGLDAVPPAKSCPAS